ncbi:MAG: sugar-binding domain-containing protein [Planctomycetota bacterium]
MSVRRQAGDAYLAFANSRPGRQVVVSQTIPLDPTWSRLRVSAKLRAKNLKPGELHWQVGRVAVIYLDASGGVIKFQKPPMLRQDRDWVTITEDHVVPEGAAAVRLEPGLHGATGQLGVDQVSLEVIGTQPAAMESTWGQEPVVSDGPKRASIVLNGQWRFAPAIAGWYESIPEGEAWGKAWVPGSWHRQPDWKRPGWLEAGTGQAWVEFKKARGRVAAGWYERPIEIPASWDGRAVEVDFWHVSTVADVFVDGRRAGQAPFGQGSVDVTPFVKPGQSHRLSIRVAAIPDASDKLFLQGENPEQIIRRTGGLSEMGITGDIELKSRPNGARISDVFVMPSFRNSTVALRVELAGVAEPGPVTFIANMLNEAGEVERRFEATGQADSEDLQVVELSFEWPDARLWDIGQPNLYTLSLQAVGPDGLNDDYRQRFGFREFWIDGKGFVLNGKPIRLRPSQFRSPFAHVESIEQVMRDAIAMGFNMVPTDGHLSGASPSTHLAAATADELGLMAKGWTIGMAAYAVDGSWSDSEVRARWERRMSASMRRLRNHPSIVIWATSANTFAHGQDQNPRFVGNSKMLDVRDEHPRWWTRAEKGLEALDSIRAVDPTRPVYAHSGSFVGDVQVANMYLNLLPLQEREEWLSAWSESGDRPFMAGEFGLPLNNTFTRGKAGGGWSSRTVGSYNSEPMVTEYGAIYFGPEAYAQESPRYRRWIPEVHAGGEVYTHALQEPVNYDPVLQRMTALFIRNTWRSWRTLGMTGGLVPWAANSFLVKPAGSESFTPFAPGRRGEWVPSLPKKEFFIISQEQSQLLPAARALVDHNGETLAWIAGEDVEGDTGAITDKKHNFNGGASLGKTAVLIHDGRNTGSYSVKWSVHVDGLRIAEGGGEGRIEPAENVRLAIKADLPRVDSRQDGEIRLVAEIAGVKHEDRFAFRVWPDTRLALAPESAAIYVMDAVGDTAAMLDALEVPYTSTPTVPESGVLVLGRKTITSADDLPEGLEAFVRDGGRLVVMGQTPGVLKSVWGFRVSPHVSRRAFPVGAGHAMTDGLDHEDLRDWAGTGTLIEPRPVYAVDPKSADVPYQHDKPWHGWRWGNRGSVSSAAVEKPHMSGWRPILQGEFDLAYSPLMELRLGRGVAVLCTLDLEDQAAADPAAQDVATRLIAYVTAQRERAVPQRGIRWAGEKADAPSWLTMVGPVLSEDAVNKPLLVFAADNPSAASGAESHLAAGGDVLLVSRRTPGAGPFGIQYRNALIDGPRGIAADPLAVGISQSETRFRVPTEWTLLDDDSLDEVLVTGLLGIKRVGNGRVIAMQWDPDRFDIDAQPYFRYTRWRHTRAITNLLANLGVELMGDAWFLDPRGRRRGEVALGGDGWRIEQTLRLEPAKRISEAHADPGISSRAVQLLWQSAGSFGVPVSMPNAIDRSGMPGAGSDGEWVVGRSFTLSEQAAERDHVIELGPLDDFDTVFINGQKIGSTGLEADAHWSVPRQYRVPATLLKAGENQLRIRIFDRFGSGGVMAKDASTLRLIDVSLLGTHRGMYHPDYRTKFDYGDDPYRYYRW